MKTISKNWVLLFLFSLALGAANAQTDKALLWKITGNGLTEPSYLFGTYHLLTDAYVNTLPEVAAPYASAKGVVVEMVLDSSKLPAMAMMMIMPNNKISKLIKPEDFERVSQELQKLMGLKLEALDQIKPMTVMTLMTLRYAQQQNAALLQEFKGLPMDVNFAAKGKKVGKTITALETQEEQMTLLFDAFPIEEQARQLVAYIDQKELALKTQADLVNLYRAKDVGGMYALSISLPQDFGSSDFLLKDRNLKWMNTLPTLMQSGSQFIAVGALHLPGPDGLIALLTKQGYTVTAVP